MHTVSDLPVFLFLSVCLLQWNFLYSSSSLSDQTWLGEFHSLLSLVLRPQSLLEGSVRAPWAYLNLPLQECLPGVDANTVAFYWFPFFPHAFPITSKPSSLLPAAGLLVQLSSLRWIFWACVPCVVYMHYICSISTVILYTPLTRGTQSSIAW